MSDEFDELNPKALLTRKQLVRFLRKEGFPLSFSTVSKLCAPSCGKGPPTAGIWAGRALHDREEGLAWARTRMRSAARRDT
jgi:hypothetical protein